MIHKTIAVIGHVDHGKTALVKALTGVETDTLKEERDRGLSITLGFASRAAQNEHLHLIDTPGHVDFVKMTASGISGADAVLLVVSALDGIEPQTKEHVKLAVLFGVRHIIVALTKSDLATETATKQCAVEVAELLAAHAVEASSIIACSSTTRDGVDALAEALDRLGSKRISRPDLPGAFLPIDRVFSSPGIGTIVTGTLLGGDLSLDAPVCIEPSGRTSSIRGLQISGEDLKTAPQGARVAINLRTIDAKAIKKGHVLCGADQFQSCELFNVTLDPVAGAKRSLRHMEQVTVLLGTAAASARIRLLSRVSDREPTQAVFAQIEFSARQSAFAGQRFVIRQPASAETLTGGTVLDPNAQLVTRNKANHISVLQAALSGDTMDIANAIAERDGGVVAINTLARLARRSPADTESLIGGNFESNGAGLVFQIDHLRALEKRFCDSLATLHMAHPCRPFISRDTIDKTLIASPSAIMDQAQQNLQSSGTVRSGDHGIALHGHDPAKAMTAEQQSAYQQADSKLREMELSSGPVFDVAHPTSEQTDLLNLLVWNNRAIRFYNHSLKQSFLLHRESVGAAAQKLSDVFITGELFTTSEARRALNTNRKTIVPLLEYFDGQSVTQRNGDLRYMVQQDGCKDPCLQPLPD